MINSNSISHSAKGSTWEQHKYVKQVDGKYYYPDGYKNGRNISSLKKESIKNRVERIKEASGDRYNPRNQIKKRTSKKISTLNKDVLNKGEEAVKKAKGIDLDLVYSVYKRQEERNNLNKEDIITTKNKADGASSKTRSVLRRI